MTEASSAALPSGVSWATSKFFNTEKDYVTPEDIANVVLAEVRKHDRSSKMTWNPDKIPVAGKAKMVGKELCLSLPYWTVDTKQYYIQNNRVYLPNGQRVTLDEVFEREGGAGCFLRVKKALEDYKKLSIAISPSLCKVCGEFEAPSNDAYMKHMIEKHADHVAAIANDQPPPVEPDPEEGFSCGECGKAFGTAKALNMHRVGSKHSAA